MVASAVSFFDLWNVPQNGHLARPWTRPGAEHREALAVKLYGNVDTLQGLEGTLVWRQTNRGILRTYPKDTNKPWICRRTSFFKFALHPNYSTSWVCTGAYRNSFTSHWWWSQVVLARPTALFSMFENGDPLRRSTKFSKVLLFLKGHPGRRQYYVNDIENSIGDGRNSIWLLLLLHFSMFENCPKMAIFCDLEPATPQSIEKHWLKICWIR